MKREETGKSGVSLKVLRDRVRGKLEDKSNESFKTYIYNSWITRLESSAERLLVRLRVFQDLPRWNCGGLAEGDVFGKESRTGQNCGLPTLAYMKSILFKQGKPGGKKGRPNHRL